MLNIQNITKSFGTNRAVDDVSLSVNRGEIVAIVGENGAGKTTLMRIAAGELKPDRGSVTIEGTTQLVHQHFMLVSNFSIAENLALSTPGGRLLRTRRAIERDAEATIAATGLDLRDVGRSLSGVSVGERAKLELIKAIAQNPDVLILDEPTAVLTPTETTELFGVIRRLAKNGTAVLFISHKLREVVDLAGRVFVMRAGRVVAKTDARSMSVEALATAMVGDRPSVEQPTAPAAQSQRTAASALSCSEIRGERLDGVTFNVGAGEIVAIVGVAGNGQGELAAILRGIDEPRSGTIALAGRTIRRDDLRSSAAVGHIPEDRTRDGVIAQMTIAENIALTATTRWQPRQSSRLAAQLIDLYSIRAQSPEQLAGSLSGGNQQKVLLARELDPRPACIVAAEPTRGLDIAATRFVHEQLRRAAGAGSGILLITSDLDEAFALGDAIHVMFRGRLSARLTPGEASHSVANLMAGVA